MKEVSLKDLRRILTKNELEYYISETNGSVMKINFMVKDEETS